MNASFPHSAPVVIIGSGLAGLTAALSLAPMPVVLVTRAALGEETSSAWAQGGIAAALGEDDSPELHLADTLAAGDGLVDEKAARAILDQAPAAIGWLEAQGVQFDRKADGALELGLEAAHCRRRIVHGKGDASGATIIRALTERVAATPSISVLSDTQARRLVLRDGRVAGVALERAGEAYAIAARAVLLATGGLGGLFDATTNPQGNFGHGIALAARAGAVLADMEFVQFHPTALASDRTPLALISEAVRGEGAHLTNDLGDRFMADVSGQELAPRDIVARAISAEIAQGRKVFLDARPALGQHFSTRFPSIAALCREAGIEPESQPIPVRPAVHYHMGGVATDLCGRTSVEGLWAVGEVAATGLHGANRLASNSLLEASVMGRLAAEDIGGLAFAGSATLGSSRPSPRPSAASIRPLVSRSLGVLRDAESMKSLIAAVRPLADENSPAADPALVALAMASFALLRQESRGAHARTDFPAKAETGTRRRMTMQQILQFADELGETRLARSA
ncbi:L-aspartate oxidase [Rhizobium helianthi]|uniref:L-aspartate oxidase n=1 Tax=Rhizobium helianthi TaxID=1132695 RepID=A0ABW4M524_9HYPH